MSDKPFNFDEFIQETPTETPQEMTEEVEETETEGVEAPELEVQQAVVQELAADKAVLMADYENLKVRKEEIEAELKKAKEEIATLQKEREEFETVLKSSRDALLNAQSLVEEVKGKLAERMVQEMDMQERNPNALALLDRDVELPDRFPGETRDHVLEVIAEARDKAEEEGRIRRAQLLEGVLVSNEPNGNLAKKRAALEKFFNENHNIMTGPVMAELDKCGISYKKGEEYLLPSEILKRTY